MQTEGQFPALMGKDALPALGQNRKSSSGKLTHPLGIKKPMHPLIDRKMMDSPMEEKTEPRDNKREEKKEQKRR